MNLYFEKLSKSEQVFIYKKSASIKLIRIQVN